MTRRSHPALLAVLVVAIAACDRPRDDPPSPPLTLPSKPPAERSSSATFLVEGGDALSRRPVLVVVASGGQLLGLHAGPPELTVFDDRRVIAKRGGGIVEGNLSADAYATLLAEVKGSGLMDLPALFTGGVLTTHSIDTSLIVADGARYKRVRVAGFHDGESEKVPVGEPREPPPSPFSKVYRRLMDLPIADPQPWKPRHSLAILQRKAGDGEPWPPSIPKPGAGRFSPAGDDALVYYVVDRSVALPVWGDGDDGVWRTTKAKGPYLHQGGAYELSHLVDTIEARAFLLHVDRCATPDASRDAACAPRD